MRAEQGLTLIELLVVMALLAILASIATPRYLDRVEQSREVVLKQNLHGMRTAIDQYYRDKAKYPESLQVLADERYIRAVPEDPMTGRTDTWVVVPPKGGQAQVFDVKSGSAERTKAGISHASW
ncbi:MAG: type II secretion system protein [Burkholderiaceae bacterium]